MADIPSTNSKIQIEETTYRAPVSETLNQRIGGSINYALDGVASNASSISSVSSSLSALTTQLNSSAEGFKQTAIYETGVPQIGTNSFYVDGTLIERDTLTIAAGGGEWWYLYFAADRVETTRSVSYLKITFANEPDFSSTVLFDGSLENLYVGFAKPLILPPGTGNFTVYVDLYAGQTISPSAQQRNRWNYRLRGFRFDPTRFIIP